VNLALGQRPVHAIAAQQVPVVEVRGFLDVIDSQLVLGADGARQGVRGARSAERVVRGEQRDGAVAQAVYPGIPNMDQMGGPSAQNQCAQGAGHPVELGIRAADRVNPTVYGIRRAAAYPRDADARGLSETGLDEAAHGKLRGHAPAFGAAHSVREGRHEADS
jgi:hypothetical protein